MGFSAAGLFFLSFFRKTRDRLFLSFAFAFWILAVERALLTFAENMNERSSLIYILRLIAFSLIIYAFIEKNKSSTGKDSV